MQEPIDIMKFQFFQDLSDLSFVEKIILYGARARGTSRDRSDIDLAIECPKATSQKWLRVLDIIDGADTLLKIDSMRFDELSDDTSLKKAILRDGRVLFVRKKDVERNR